MRPIPTKLREEMEDDSFYQFCCLRDLSQCSTTAGVQWHHHLIYAGRQVNEKFCILPLCPLHHDHIHLPKAKWNANKIMFERATEEQIEKYDLHQLKDYVENREVPDQWRI